MKKLIVIGLLFLVVTCLGKEEFSVTGTIGGDKDGRFKVTGMIIFSIEVDAEYNFIFGGDTAREKILEMKVSDLIENGALDIIKTILLPQVKQSKP